MLSKENESVTKNQRKTDQHRHIETQERNRQTDTQTSKSSQAEVLSKREPVEY